MWFVVNGFDLSDIVEHDQASGEASTSDPLPTFSLLVDDIGSQLALTFGMPVVVWDETIPSTLAFQPTHNLLINATLYNNGGTSGAGSWTNGGTLSALWYFPNFEAQITFNNNAIGSATCSQITSSAYAIASGQQYIFAIYVVATSPVNIQYQIQITWLDASQNVIYAEASEAVAPPTTQQHVNVSGQSPPSAAYAQVEFIALTTSTTNSGTITFSTPQFEPMLFVGESLADGTPIVYPSPDCNYAQIDCAVLPDQTVVRRRLLFNGYIKAIKITYDGTNRQYQLDCASLGDVIDNGAIINNTFEATTDQSMINTLVSQYFSTSLATGQQNAFAPSTTVQFGQTISGVTFGDCSMRDVMNSLTDATGFIYFVDPYLYLHYNDVPFDYATFTVNVESPDYVSSFPPQNYQVEYDGSQLRNSVKVLGGQYYTTSSDTFSPNGTAKDFTLTSQPQNLINVSISGSTYAPTSSNKIGVYGQDTLGQNGVIVTYDRTSSVVHFQTAPSAGANTLVITYATYRNVSVQVEDNNSAGQYQRHFYAKVTDTSIVDNPTAQTRGLAEIGKYAYPLLVLTFDLENAFADRGTTILVYSALDGFNPLPCVVQQVKLASQGGGVNIYSYTCGQYRPNMIDAMRNTSKALQSNTASSGSTVIQETIETVNENLYYGEQILPTLVGPNPGRYNRPASQYGSTTWS